MVHQIDDLTMNVGDMTSSQMENNTMSRKDTRQIGDSGGKNRPDAKTNYELEERV